MKIKIKIKMKMKNKFKNRINEFLWFYFYLVLHSSTQHSVIKHSYTPDIALFSSVFRIIDNFWGTVDIFTSKRGLFRDVKRVAELEKIKVIYFDWKVFWVYKDIFWPNIKIMKIII
jgi:hypothetical protein